MEQWRPIPSYEGLYEVSDQGRIRSVVKRMRTRIGDILRGSRYKVGYCYMRLTVVEGAKKRHYLHRLVLCAFNPVNEQDQLEVNHQNGDKGDNRLVNLEWCSHRENIIHARVVLESWRKSQEINPKKSEKIAKGTARGEHIKNSKLTVEQVREIRRLYADGKRQYEIAPLFGVTQSTVSTITNRKQWAHVD